MLGRRYQAECELSLWHTIIISLYMNVRVQCRDAGSAVNNIGSQHMISYEELLIVAI